MECIFCDHKPCICNHTEDDARNYGIQLGKAGGNTDNPYSYGTSLYAEFRNGVAVGKQETVVLTTVIDKDESNRLPGAMIMFASVCSSGSSEDQWSVGVMDISLHRPGQKYPWLDLGCINYSHPTEKQLMDAETSPRLTEGWKAHSNIHRRVSKTQARYISLLIQEMLMNEFKGVIPSDDEIKELAKQRFPLDRV